MTQRVGIGFDSHPLVAGRPCVLGGVAIPHPKGPQGHSDGDAVLHAIADALLGAAGADDLGTLFPDTDPKWKGADSADLLRAVVARVRKAGFGVVNVDVVVLTDGPRIAPHRGAIRTRLGRILGVPATAVNVKGKSLEGLAGRDVVTAHAVCLLSRTARGA